MTLLRLASHTRASTTPNLGNDDVTPWDRAACRDLSDDTMYPEARMKFARERQIANAKLLCNGHAVMDGTRIPGCPIRDFCRNHALTTGETWGIWGGLAEDERVGLYTTEVSA